MMNRKTYYDVLLAGCIFIIIYYVFSTFIFAPLGVYLPLKYFGHLKNIFAFFIILYEIINSDKIIKRICVSLLPVAFIGKLFIIMHWPFGFIIFIASALAVWILLAINAYRSGVEVALKIIILLYPLTRIVFHQVFLNRHIVWPLVDSGVIVMIIIMLAIKMMKPGNNYKTGSR
jgi:hypothetical protein